MLVEGSGEIRGHREVRASDQDECDRVACVVALYPPTDIRTWVTDPPEAIRSRPNLKPPLTFDHRLWIRGRRSIERRLCVDVRRSRHGR